MKQYWVYLLLCSDGSFYTGITDDVDRRVEQHHRGTDPWCYTFGRRPLHLAYRAAFPDPDQAIAFEKRVKGWSRAKKAAMIRGDWAALRRLAHPSLRSG